jgi:Na+/citrate or Na+/malate symporter
LTIEIPPWLGVTIMLIVCGAALWKGEVEERLTGAALLLNAGANVAMRDRSWPHIQTAAFVADSLLLVLLVAIALRTPKFWPLPAAAFVLLNVLTHVAKLIDPVLQQWAYMTAIVIWTYLIYAALGVGTWNVWRARR